MLGATALSELPISATYPIVVPEGFTLGELLTGAYRRGFRRSGVLLLGGEDSGRYLKANNTRGAYGEGTEEDGSWTLGNMV